MKRQDVVGKGLPELFDTASSHGGPDIWREWHVVSPVLPLLGSEPSGALSTLSSAASADQPFPVYDRCSDLSFEATTGSAIVKARRILCRYAASFATCLSQVFSFCDPLFFAVRLDKLNGHTLSIGLVADSGGAVDDDLRSLAGRTMVGSRALAPGVALMSAPGFVGVVVGGYVTHVYPIAVADGAVVVVSRDEFGYLDFVVDGVRLPRGELLRCRCEGPARVGISLTARGQRVSFPLRVDTEAFRDATHAELQPRRTVDMPPSTQYDEVVTFHPTADIAVGGDVRMLRCHLAGGAAIPPTQVPRPFAAHLAQCHSSHVKSQQEIHFPADAFALPVFVNDAKAAFGVGLCAHGGNDQCIGVWVRPLELPGEPARVIAELWSLDRKVAGVSFEHDLCQPLRVHFTAMMGFDAEEPLTEVVVAINDRVCGPVAGPSGTFRAALVFTQAGQEMFLGMTPPDFVQASSTSAARPVHLPSKAWKCGAPPS